MKTVRLLIYGLVMMAGLCHGQNVTITNEGWFTIGSLATFGVTNYESDDGTTNQSNYQPEGLSSPPAIAEAITPEIQSLADGLQDNPLQIFNYVHDHIRFVLYFGCQKGAELTLLEKSGNDFDQCALTVALLRAAGYTSASYQFGWMLLPYDNPDGSNRDLHHWLGLSLIDTNWSNTSTLLDDLFRYQRQFPTDAYNFGTNIFAFQRVWVTLPVGTNTYLLDPAFKVSEPIAGINLATAMGFNSNALISVAGGLDVGSATTNFYVTNLNEASIRGTLTGYTTNLLKYMQTNCPNASVAQVLGGQYIIPAGITVLPQTNLFLTTNLYGTMPVINWLNIPTNMMATLGVSFLGTNEQFFVPQLAGGRLSLTVSSTGLAQLWLEDSNSNLIAGHTGGGTGQFSVALSTYQPAGSWNTTSNVFVPQPVGQSVTKNYQAANATYVFTYAYEPDWGWLQERENKLDSYLAQGLTNGSRPVVSETLNIMALSWQLQVDNVSRILGQQIGVLPMFYFRAGRMAQELGYGYYVDVFLNLGGPASTSSPTDNHVTLYQDLWTYFASALEHGMIEQLQATNLTAASTIKLLELANTNHQAVYLVNSSNSSIVLGKLSFYNSTADGTILDYLPYGFNMLLPQSGAIQIAGTGSWIGYGILAQSPSEMVMSIGDSSGTHSGGYVSDPNATVDPGFIDSSGDSQPLYFASTPATLPPLTGADPVDLADGTFQVQDVPDLALGGTEPRGLNLSRYYNSSRRNSDLAGIAPGWIQNYFLNAATISAPPAEMGSATPAQMASILVATTTALGIYDAAHPDPKDWLSTALVIKWGIDQLTAKAVSVTLGQNTFQFIQQPNGAYTPPANCTMTLLETNGAYQLQERHGRTFAFNGAGWATNIVDQYNASLSLTYNRSNLVQKVTDWKGRTLTFNYNSGTSNRLLSVTDNSSPARTVSYGYSAAGDLTSVTDPQGSTNTFLYDTNHQIIATINAAGQVVASNIYNSFGRVTTQYTEGLTNKLWRIYWSGWQTVSQDPAGGQQAYFYDDQTRLVGHQDALGHLTQSFYDGQDHVTNSVSPLGETDEFVYDGNNNLLTVIDPLGHSNTFSYDTNNNLVAAVDANGHSTTFGYNAQFSIIGQTNGAGDWVNYIYNPNGTLASRTDSGGETQYGYDSYGQLNLITYPATLGGESFVNSSLGDVTSHTDANGNITTMGYNARRQLTNSVAPTNLVNRLAYDPVGNTVTATDARGNSLTNTWSATRHLLATTLPATPQGTVVVTNIYDVRDWLVETLDPYQKPTLITNDAAQRLVARTDPLQRTTIFAYDSDNHLLAAVNAAHETNSQTWDARGRVLSQTDGAGHFITFTNDAAGNQVGFTNRNAHPWQFVFDAANRLVNTITPLGRSNLVVFNHQGLPTLLIDQAGQQTTNAFDGLGRLVSRADKVGLTTNSYDGNNNLLSVVENGNTNAWTYDAYNRVSSYHDVYGNLIQYRYDANGNLTNLIYPGNRTVAYSYDTLNRLTNVVDWSGRKTSLTYDLNSHLTTVTRPNGTYRTLSYDAAGEVTNIWEQMANGLPIAWFRLNWTNSGNMAWEFAAPLPHTNSPPARTMTYNADNELSTVNTVVVTNDPDGNLVYGPTTNTSFTTCTYDARNRLLNAGGVTNAYDALNNRIGQLSGTSTAVYVVDPNPTLPQVLMRIKNGVTNYYIYGAGLMYQITERATGTNTLTYHYDYRGSTVALSSDSGLVTDRVEYSLYGSTTYRAGTNDTPFLFDGQYGVQTDPNGLLYMRARYCNPYLCRFISPDPSGFKGGLNFYAYANGNPVSYVDPFGLGALGESALTSSWFDAPTEEQTAIQNGLAAFANLVTFGMANEVANALGDDIYGNFVTPEQQQAAGINVATSLFPVVGIEGAGVRVAADFSDSIARAANTTATQLEFSFVDGLSGKPPIQWPPNGGFAGDPVGATLVPGTTIDRFGLANGSYVSPTGTPFVQRSLAPGTQYLPYNSYTVLKPINVQAGPAAPAFGMPGGGTQFKLPSSVQSLINSGHLGTGN